MSGGSPGREDARRRREKILMRISARLVAVGVLDHMVTASSMASDLLRLSPETGTVAMPGQLDHHLQAAGSREDGDRKIRPWG
jgi:hypothetical protein